MKHQFYYLIKDTSNFPLFIGKGGTNIRQFIKSVKDDYNDVNLIINFGYFVEKNSKKKFCEIKKGDGITHLRFRITYSNAKINDVTKFIINHFTNIENQNIKKKTIFGTWTPEDSKNIGFICGKNKSNLDNIKSECDEEAEIWFSKKNKCFNIKCKSDKDLALIKNCLERSEKKCIQWNLPKQNLKKEKKDYTHVVEDFPSLGKNSYNNAKNISSSNFWGNAKKVNIPGEFNLSEALFKQKEAKRVEREIEEKKMREELEEFESDEDFSDDESYYSEVECY